MPLQGIFEWNSLLVPAANAFERAFGSVQVFEIIKVLQNRLADIEGFSAASAPRQLFKPFFDRLRKSNSQHGTPVYKYSISLWQRHCASRVNDGAREGVNPKPWH